MIVLNSPAEARALLKRARELQAQDALLTTREALHEACAELAETGGCCDETRR